MLELLEKGASNVEVALIPGVKRNTIYRLLRFGNTSQPERGPGFERRELTGKEDETFVAEIGSTPAVTQTGLVRRIRELYASVPAYLQS